MILWSTTTVVNSWFIPSAVPAYVSLHNTYDLTFNEFEFNQPMFWGGRTHACLSQLLFYCSRTCTCTCMCCRASRESTDWGETQAVRLQAAVQHTGRHTHVGWILSAEPEAPTKIKKWALMLHDCEWHDVCIFYVLTLCRLRVCTCIFGHQPGLGRYFRQLLHNKTSSAVCIGPHVHVI